MTETPSQREQIEQALPELPEAQICPVWGGAVLEYFDADQMRAYALAAIESLRAQLVAERAKTVSLTETVAIYANGDNWTEDFSGIRRVWLEPDSFTPASYNGFELARTALSATQPQGDSK